MNPTFWVIAVNVNKLKNQKAEIDRMNEKNKVQLYGIYKKHNLDSETRVDWK